MQANRWKILKFKVSPQCSDAIKSFEAEAKKCERAKDSRQIVVTLLGIHGGDEDEEAQGRDRDCLGCRAERVETKSVMLSLDRGRGKGKKRPTRPEHGSTNGERGNERFSLFFFYFANVA